MSTEMSTVKKAALHNLGCRVNSYEMEAMQQSLEKAGYEIVPFAPGADVYVINTCTVTNIADRKSRQMLHRAKKMNPGAIVVAVGCYVQVRGEELAKDPDVDIVIGSSRKSDLVKELRRFERAEAERAGRNLPASGDAAEGRKTAEAGSAVAEVGAEPDGEEVAAAEVTAAGGAQTDIGVWNRNTSYERLEIDRTEEHTRAFIKVQDGCNQFCSYCIIPYARGRVRSRQPEDVEGEVRRLAASGVREVIINGIHLCSYGSDFSGEDGGKADAEDGSGNGRSCRCAALLDLVRRAAAVEGIERIRLGSLEPGFLDEELIRGLAAIPALCPHFHLSLQSGCARTLRNMNRHYTPEDFQRVVGLLRRYFDHPAICTDIITGFPGETEEDFEECRQFVEQIHFFETHIFPYSRRRGTLADRMDGQNTEAVKRKRAAVLHRLDTERRKEFLRWYIGKPLQVLFEEQTVFEGRTCWTGHGREYQKVLLADSRDLSNQIVTVTPLQLAGDDALLAM